MTFKDLVAFWIEHGTKILGTFATTVATALLIDGLIPDAHMKYWLFANALLGGATVKRGFTNTATVRDGNNQAGFARPLMLAILLTMALATALLTGCASNRGQELTYRIVTNQAVQRYIWDAKSEDERAGRAERIHEAATKLRALASGTEVTLDLLRAAAYQEIARRDDLIPPDVALLRALVDAVVDYLEEQAGEGLLNPEQLLRVTEVLDWIIGAAVYVPAVEPAT